MTNRIIAVHEREVAIVSYFQKNNINSRTIRDCWEELSTPPDENESGSLGDTASISTYHRTIAKLVRRGVLLQDSPSEVEPATFKATDQLSAMSAFTLNEIEMALWERSAPEALAMYLDAVDYYESKAVSILGQAALGLLKEDPRKLIIEMLKDELTCLSEDILDLKHDETNEPQHRRTTERRLSEIRSFVYGELGINPIVWQIPDLEDALAGKKIEPNWDKLSESLAEHVFGNSFIQRRIADNPSDTEMVVAGTDGSSHAGYVRGVPAPAYAESEGRLVMTFNNSVAFVHMSADENARFKSPYHGVPMTRSALEDPHNRGMIISRPWFPGLTDSEFEHMKKAALDVVQFRVDARLMEGMARAYGSNAAKGDGGLLPKPNVLIRDGTVTPQEREFQHYTNNSAYGETVREGIALSLQILNSVESSNKRVFAGSVKHTVLRTFSRIVNWYIRTGSKVRFGKAIDPSWDLSRVSHVTDTVSMTRLIIALPVLSDNEYYCTCAIVRGFSAMVTDLRGVEAESEDDWLKHFARKRDNQVKEFKENGGERPWLAGKDLDDDPYVRMCQKADYGIFFFGKPGGSPSLVFPRFEFMDSLRKMNKDQRMARVEGTCQRIINSVHQTKWSLDRDHNFLTSSKMPRLIPFVVYEAHEKCKVMGHKLEGELRQAIAMRLSQMKGSRGLPIPKVDIDPIAPSEFLNDYSPKKIKDSSESPQENKEDF